MAVKVAIRMMGMWLQIRFRVSPKLQQKYLKLGANNTYQIPSDLFCTNHSIIWSDIM